MKTNLLIKFERGLQIRRSVNALEDIKDTIILLLSFNLSERHIFHGAELFIVSLQEIAT